MHLNRSQFFKNIWHLFQRWPVQLKILPSCYMNVTFVIVTANACQFADLLTVECAVGHCNTEHGCMTLDVKTILKPYRQQLFWRNFSCQKALCLLTKLSNTLINDSLIKFVILVHGLTAK